MNIATRPTKYKLTAKVLKSRHRTIIDDIDTAIDGVRALNSRLYDAGDDSDYRMALIAASDALANIRANLERAKR